MKKDIQRGTMNRVAEDASVLGEGNSPADHSHVRKITPLETKAMQMETAPDVNVEREARTTRLRRDKDVKPI